MVRNAAFFWGYRLDVHYICNKGKCMIYHYSRPPPPPPPFAPPPSLKQGGGTIDHSFPRPCQWLELRRLSILYSQARAAVLMGMPPIKDSR